MAEAAKQVQAEAKSCDDMRRIGRQRAPQTSGDLGRIRIRDLPPELRQPIAALEAGLKYLIVGSLGSATLLYGLAMIYGATGATGATGAPAGAERGTGPPRATA